MFLSSKLHFIIFHVSCFNYCPNYSRFHCNGNERSLLQCPHQNLTERCSNMKRASAICFNGPMNKSKIIVYSLIWTRNPLTFLYKKNYILLLKVDFTVFFVQILTSDLSRLPIARLTQCGVKSACAGMACGVRCAGQARTGTMSPPTWLAAKWASLAGWLTVPSTKPFGPSGSQSSTVPETRRHWTSVSRTRTPGVIQCTPVDPLMPYATDTVRHFLH